MPVAWGQRKTLRGGRNFGYDPALALAQMELEQRYALMPGQETRRIQQEQFGQTMGLEREKLAEQGKSGMIGTLGNVAGTAMLLRAYTMNKGEPFFGNWGRKTSPGGMVTYPEPGITPASYQTGTPVIGEGGEVTTPALGEYGEVVSGGEEAGMGMGTGGGTSLTAAGAWGAGGGYVGGEIGKSRIAENVPFSGGKRERAVTGGVMGGVVAGGLATSWSGPGMIVGGIVGGLVGYLGKNS